jgi:hypothetical protein
LLASIEIPFITLALFIEWNHHALHFFHSQTRHWNRLTRSLVNALQVPHHNVQHTVGGCLGLALTGYPFVLATGKVVEENFTVLVFELSSYLALEVIPHE